MRGCCLGWMSAAIAVLSLACGPAAIGGDAADDDTGGVDAGPGGRVDSGGPPPPHPESAFVYAHSASDLYKIDPDTLAVAHVGPFAWPAGADQMTDIAIDKAGNMIGISFGTVYAVDKDTAQATALSTLTASFNGLSFVPAAEIDPTGDEVLIATALDGSVHRIDPMTGVSTPIGNYGGSLTSSGDVVSVTGFGTVATVKQGSAGNDLLARVDPSTGVATIIGDTGVADIWGVGFWENKVFGFTSGRQFVLIDVTTGQAMQVEAGDIEWWGAGVTTSAPVIE